MQYLLPPLVGYPSVHETEAIAFLRALIHEPPHEEGEEIDAGWCVYEHAKVAQIAWNAIGRRAVMVEGLLMYFDRANPQMSFQMQDHRFLLIEEATLAGMTPRKPRIFDSAAHYGGVEGLSTAWWKAHPDLEVILFDQKITEEITIPTSKRHTACYAMLERESLDTDVVTFETDSTLCQWIEFEYGKRQPQLGSSVIATTIRLLLGDKVEAPMPFTRENQKALWRWIAQRPDERQFIADRLWR